MDTEKTYEDTTKADKPTPYSREEYCIENGDKKIYGELYRPAGSLSGESADSEKPPILIMSHGFNGSSEAMRYEAERMAKRGVAVYCYDFCGGSHVPWSCYHLPRNGRYTGVHRILKGWLSLICDLFKLLCK